MDLVTLPRGSAGLGIGGKIATTTFSFDGSDTPLKLNGAQKAAVIVQMILRAGGAIPLSVMSEATQVHLARVYASMGPINKATVASVLTEFATHLDAHGLSFPVDTSSALDALEGNLSESLLERMRQVHSPSLPKNTWELIADLPPELLAERIAKESPRVGAIIMSKLPAAAATNVMELLDGETANAVTFAMSETEAVRSETVDIIAQTILDSGDTPDESSAFATKPVARAASLLNAAGASQRDAVLEALETLDAVFAAQVRKAIFTFADILTRLKPTDIPAVIRILPGDELNAALKAGSEAHEDVVEFILENLSKRMADAIREEMSELSPLSGKAAETAMGKVTAAIRQLEESGDVTLITIDDEDTG
ncbi:FliG C-terminal domain-containing protein [Litoreibacter arenae]|uniref:Flagellar motor switch protein FliG n=1 Tax=Litoreibacter arenae DSM 19593 TaxID=1123360 RepID=S9S161_9RHOB|nr:FliG C-terminal domain-containing protein [Litoreibacter arenae]EPX79969.1 flagellar motor switch protein FliG, putative [Litoreibacter arenae DSM 19593]